MKTILYIYHTSTIGGGSYCLLNILKNINREKILPYVLLCNEGPLVGEIKNLGIDVYFIPTLRTVPYNSSTLKPKALKNAVNIFQSMEELKHILRQLKIDVVYCNTMMLYPYLRSAKVCGCRTVIHIREHWPKNEHKWQRNIALRHIAKYADEIVAINRYSASMISPYNRKATIVYDWIDLSSRYENMPLNEIFGEDMTNKKTFLFLGGMQAIKGVKEVLLAFTKKILNEDYRLLILGLDVNYKTKGFRGKIKKILSLFGIKSFSEEIIALAKADKRIVCIPSVYNIRHLYEQAYCIISYFTIPHANLALAESIICNAVNVAARTDESLEYSLEGELAVLYKENDFDDFISKLESIKSYHNEMVNKMKIKSSLIQDMFSPQVNVKRLNNLLENI